MLEGFRRSLWEPICWLPLLTTLVPNANTDGVEVMGWGEKHYTFIETDIV